MHFNHLYFCFVTIFTFHAAFCMESPLSDERKELFLSMKSTRQEPTSYADCYTYGYNGTKIPVTKWDRDTKIFRTDWLHY